MRILITIACLIFLFNCTGLQKDGTFPQAAADKNIFKKIHNGIMDFPTTEPPTCVWVRKGESYCY